MPAGFAPDCLPAYMLRGRINVDADTYHAVILSALPSQATVATRADLSEVSGAGYVAGGAVVVLTLPAVVAHVQSLAVGSVTWTGVTLSAAPAGFAIVKWRGGLASADEVIGIVGNTGTAYGVGVDYTMPATSFPITCS